VILRRESYLSFADIPGAGLYDIMAGTEGMMEGERR